MTTSTPHLTPEQLASVIAATDREVVTLGDRHGLRSRRTYATDVADLWSAWTEPERMARWLGRPFGELREGGDVKLVMDGPGSSEPVPEATTGFATVRILHCDAPSRLTVRWVWEDEPPSVVDLTLTPVDADHTLLELDHVILSKESAVGYGAGWENFLARLDAAVQGTVGWPDDIETQLAKPWRAAATTTTSLRLPVITQTGSTKGAPGSAVGAEAAEAAEATEAAEAAEAAEATGGEARARIELDRWIAASATDVWACLATTDGLRRWYVTDIVGDLVVGGAFRCSFDQGDATGEILACETGRELAVSWRWDGADHSSRMTVTLEPESRDGIGGTHVRWREDDATGNVTAYGAGLHAHMVGLDRAARGLTSTPSRWSADFVIAHSGLSGTYRNIFDR